MPTSKLKQRMARKRRIRRGVSGNPARPRMTVFRSLKNIYVQVIDDVSGNTLVQASSLDRELKSAISEIRSNPPQAPEVKEGEGEGKKKKKGKKPAPLPTVNKLICEKVGEEIAKRCKEKQIDAVVFDRNGYKYHGRVKFLAEAARKAGLSF